MLLDITNNYCNVAIAKNVYGLYVWKDNNNQPKSVLVVLKNKYTKDPSKLIAEVQNKYSTIEINHCTATLSNIYVDNQNAFEASFKTLQV